MTELELFKFICEHEIEYHWWEDEVILIIDNWLINDWYSLLKESSIFDEERIPCTMKNGYFCFEMADICDHFGIKIENVFEKE